MKKTLTLLLIMLLLVGCSKKASMPNPMTVHDSLEEVNEITHGNIVKPAVMGISNEEFYTIDTGNGIIGQYAFMVNGIGYMVRFSDTILKEDISGIYIDGNPAFNDDISNVKAKGEGYYLARFFTTDGQYVLIAEDKVEEEIFNLVLEELTTLSSNK